jgi:hypothetical protein
VVDDPWDAEMAAHQARRAIRRGDLAAAERWFKLAERAVAIAQRLAKMAQDEVRPRPMYNPINR